MRGRAGARLRLRPARRGRLSRAGAGGILGRLGGKRPTEEDAAEHAAFAARTRAFDLGVRSVRDVPESERPARQAEPEPEPEPTQAEIVALRRSLEEMIGVSTSLYRALRTAGLRVTEGAPEIIERLERARSVLKGTADRELFDEVD